MRYGQIGLVLALLWVPVFAGAEDGNETELTRNSKLRDIAFRHVFFAQYQEKHREAYLNAEYYKQRRIDDPSIVLTQAAASLELGFLELGRSLIDELDEGALLPENQSRLRVYLARDAYRRRD